MTFLLDTNAISEVIKPRPNAGVMDWFGSADEDTLYLSVITLAELRHGVERLAAGSRRASLDRWLSADLPDRFEGRILPVDARTADAWGRGIARAQAAGRTIGAMDGFIAATAMQHQLTLVTRNLADFQPVSVQLFCPWT